MPAQVKVTLSEDDKKRLIKNTRCRTTPIRLVERSKIVLLASQGQPNYKIAQKLGIDVNKVGRWRNVVGLYRSPPEQAVVFCKEVNKQTPADKALHLIIDNDSTHKQEDVKKWLKKNKRVHLHFIPTSSSWLNLVERFFGLLTEKQLQRGVFTSAKELEAASYNFIARHNESPKPFVWTKSAEAILEKVNRARTVLRNQQTV